MKYVVILGRQSELGLIELESVLGAAAVESFGAGAALVSKAVQVARYGGVVKTGAVFYEGPARGLRELPVESSLLPMKQDGKTNFALSVYGLRTTARAVEAAGIELKKALRARGGARYVAAKEGLATTAAQLKFNGILTNGFEILAVYDGRGRMVLALTTGFQDVDWYSTRDYGRPERSARVGMLPPKLAQIMVNTTKAPMVYDPFCGTGVVLQEALLLGRAAAGSDLSAEMVRMTRANLEWLPGAAGRRLLSWSVEETDARTVRLPDMELAVVSEGYLGPNLTVAPRPAELARIREELRELYRTMLKNLARQLESGADLAICVPAWRAPVESRGAASRGLMNAKGRKNAWNYLEIVDDLPRLGYNVKVFKHVHGPILYSRPDQIVGRQILLLRKK